MYANSQAGGKDVAPGDVCLTPPLPVPISYTNRAEGNEAVPNVGHIFYGGGNVHNMNTIIPATHDDEPGSAGGVASGTVAAQSQQIKGSGKYFIMGSPITRLTDTNRTNSTNITGSRQQPSQTKILVLS